ncbi:MAG: hypothetical protein V3T64_14270 [Myxococcota bacterium]
MRLGGSYKQAGAGVPGDRYAIQLLADLSSSGCPNLSESVSVGMLIIPFSYNMSAASGCHDFGTKSS